MNGYRRNEYSQNGEDGVIEYILKTLGIDESTCTMCEFGGVDCVTYSNTFRCAKKGAKVLYIEGDEKHYTDDVKKLCHKYKNITYVSVYVAIEGENSLENILVRNGFPTDLDLLSVDVDSIDYGIWKHTNVNAKVVVIEPIGETIFSDEIIIRNDGMGPANYNAFEELGKTKGYTRVCNTGNLIFVRNDLVHNFTIDDSLFPWWQPNELKQLLFTFFQNKHLIQEIFDKPDISPYAQQLIKFTEQQNVPNMTTKSDIIRHKDKIIRVFKGLEFGYMSEMTPLKTIADELACTS
jgi:hypothetical protein